MSQRIIERIKAREANGKLWLDRVTKLAESEEWNLLAEECYLGASMFRSLNDDLNELADREQLADQKAETSHE